jgi:methylated-DNA-[protein]-cysteine S-methyltransferase
MVRHSKDEAAGETWRADTVRHPVLPLLFALDRDDALVYVGLGAQSSGLMRHARLHGASVHVETRRQTAAGEQLAEYLTGRRRDFDLDVRLLGTSFQQEAWAALRAIPFGETRSYAEQAEAMNRPGAARAVGHANGRNPVPIVVPCHRVIGHDGSLTGFGCGLPIKRWLLEHESPQGSLPLWETELAKQGTSREASVP